MVPYAPVSHPFFERLVGTIRREHLDRVFFWNALDRARKLGEFRDYYNAHRVHRSLDGATPAQRVGASSHLVLPHLVVPLGASNAAVCFRRQLRLTTNPPPTRLVNTQYKWSIMFASTEEDPTIDSRPQLPPFAANAAHQRVLAATGTWNTRDTARDALTYTPGSTCRRNRAQFFSGRLGR